jgi:hypothetical protein
MQKKNLETLSKERCSTIITQADEKLTARYSPLNWAQMLEPLFRLQDDGIDTNLLRLFFEDKKMPRIARKFDLMNTDLSRAEFIEVLSSPELLDFDGYEDDQSSLFEDQPSAPKEIGNNNSQTVESNEKDEPEEWESEEQELKTDETEEIEEEADNSLNAAFGEELEQEEDEEAASEREDDEKEEKEDSGEETENPENSEEIIEEEEQEDVSPDTSTTAVEEQEESEIDTEITSRSEETPMWMRYMSDEEIEEYKEELGAEEDEEIDEDGFIDEPIIDLTEEDASDEEIKNLHNMLSDEEELFVEQIFGGSDRAFDQAIEDIAAYDSWRDVSKYIEKDIFKRNLVDMYSEAAVDFTDRLQSYFLEKQNRNKQES